MSLALNNKNTNQKVFGWLRENNKPIYFTLHLPKANQVFDKAIIVCPPLGFEYTHSHRTLKKLCENLADSGFAALRLDYYGTGDSSGELLESVSKQQFIDDIQAAVDYLKTTLSINKISLIGLRVGATIASAYAEINNIEELILWSPCEKGKSFIREMKALNRLASHSESKPQGYIDSGGFTLSFDTAKSIEEFNLFNLDINVTNKILLIERDDFPSSGKLLAHLSKTHSTDSFLMSQYLSMMAEPQETTIPFETIKQITHWLLESKQKTINLSITAPKTSTKINWNNTNIKESTVEIGDNKLTAIFSEPYDKSVNDHPIVLLANSGTVHKVGPNRLYVELTRALSSNNTTCLRIDLRNLGDSVNGSPENENTPYPAESTQDLETAIKWLENKYPSRKIILAGLCSGAHNIFHTALESSHTHNIYKIIMINPLAFYRRPNNYIDNSKDQSDAKNATQYQKSLMSANKWKKIFRGNVNFTYIINFVFKLIFNKFKSIYKQFKVILNFDTESQLALDLIKLKDKNIKQTFIIASNDPGEKLIMQQAKITVQRLIQIGQIKILPVANADHTFSSKPARDKFINIVNNNLNF